MDEKLAATVSSVALVEGHFPPFDDEKILFPEGQGVRITLNVEILYRLASALSDAGASFGRDHSDAVTLEFMGADKPIGVRVGRGHVGADIRGILMPINSGDETEETGKANARAWARMTAPESSDSAPVPARKPRAVKPGTSKAAPEPVAAPAPEPVKETIPAGTYCLGCTENKRAIPCREGLCDSCADTLARARGTLPLVPAGELAAPAATVSFEINGRTLETLSVPSDAGCCSYFRVSGIHAFNCARPKAERAA